MEQASFDNFVYMDQDFLSDLSIEKQVQFLLKNKEYINFYDVSDEVLKMVILDNPYNIQYIKKPSEELQMFALKINPNVIDEISNPSESVVKLYKEVSEEKSKIIDYISDLVLKYHEKYFPEFDNINELYINIKPKPNIINNNYKNIKYYDFLKWKIVAKD